MIVILIIILVVVGYFGYNYWKYGPSKGDGNYKVTLDFDYDLRKISSWDSITNTYYDNHIIHQIAIKSSDQLFTFLNDRVYVTIGNKGGIPKTFVIDNKYDVEIMKAKNSDSKIMFSFSKYQDDMYYITIYIKDSSEVGIKDFTIKEMNNWFSGFPSNINIHWFTMNNIKLVITSKYDTLYNNTILQTIRTENEMYDTDVNYSIDLNKRYS